ncbi:MAG TPA: ATP-binding protein [Ktedonobacterales bacterium]
MLGEAKGASHPAGAGEHGWRQRAEASFAWIPLRWRLVAVCLGLLVLLMVGLATLTIFYERHAMLETQAAALRSEAQLAVQAGDQDDGLVTLLPPNVTPPPVGPLPYRIGVGVAFYTHRLAGASTNVVVYSTNGTVLVTSDDVPQAPTAAIVSPEQVQRAATTAHDQGWYMVARNAEGHRQLVTLLPVVVNGATAMVLQIGTPTEPIDDAIAATRLVLVLGLLGALVLGVLLTPPLVRAALRPLREMERASTRISGGDLSLRLREPPTQDEIGRLAHAFNRMVARLDTAFTRQKRFVADVSHELRTPLTALGGGMEMLLIGAERGDPETSRRLMRGMYAEVERMRRLVEDLLTLTRLDEGRIQLRIERLAPGALLGTIAEQAEQLARGQEVRAEIAPDLPDIQADADRLRQVLLNLVDNALKFTPTTGVVTLVARQEETGQVALEVADTGVGIPPEALPHVFERFFRADFARARLPGQVGGSGLGLAIAKSLIEASGGQISVESELGQGTRVTVRFPAVAADLSAPAPNPALPAASER